MSGRFPATPMNSFNNICPSVMHKEKYLRHLNNLERRKELILFNYFSDDEEAKIEALSKLIKFFRDDIRKLKDL